MSSIVDIATEHGVLDAHLFLPDAKGAWPAVILLTDIRGVRPAFQTMGQRLADHGYAVLLPNVYYRGGRAPVVDPKLPVKDDSARAQRAALRAALTPAAVRADIAALLTFLGEQTYVRGNSVGIVGYCMSGAFALRAAADFPERIIAAASFHGGGLASAAPDSPQLEVARIQARLYFGYADADASMPPDMIDRLETALREAGVSFSAELYTGARHGFAVSDGQAYDEQAAEQHWQRLLDLLGTAFAERAH